MKHRRSLLAMGVLVLAMAGCGPDREPRAVEAPWEEPYEQPVRLLLNWFPEAEHGGYYAALVHCYYEDVGLDVEILPGGPGASVVPRVATGTVEFGVENADHVIMARAQGANVLAVAAPIQIHPRCIMVHEESGIERLEDLHGVTLAMNAGGAFSHYLRKHVALKNVKIVPFNGNITQFLTDKTVAQQAYVFSEPYAAQQAGAKPRVLMLSEIGFNPYTSCLLTSSAFAERNPSAVKRMVAASMRGWQTYLEDGKKTNEAIHQSNPEMDLAVLEFGRRQLKDLVLDETAKQQGIGTMNDERWSKLHEQLVEIDLVPADAVQPQACYSLEYLPESQDAAQVTQE